MREFDILNHIYRRNASLPPHVTLPPGDDMGMVRIGNADVLVTVDQIADGLHFSLADTPLEKIARKAITRNLSDVAAMAAKPVGAVVAACLPRDFGDARATALFDAMRATADVYACPIFGGDVSMWDHPLLISVTILAEPAGVTPVRRGGAKPGDTVCVTGELGGSLETIGGYTHHLDFEPRLAVARALATQFNLRAMIDLSDGLARDLGHIAELSGVAAVVDTSKLPISPAAHTRAARLGLPAWRCAVGDGEDYELCFTLAASDAVRLPLEIEGVRITPIGQIVAAGAGSRVVLKMPDGSSQPLNGLGWEHHG